MKALYWSTIKLVYKDLILSIMGCFTLTPKLVMGQLLFGKTTSI